MAAGRQEQQQPNGGAAASVDGTDALEGGLCNSVANGHAPFLRGEVAGGLATAVTGDGPRPPSSQSGGESQSPGGGDQSTPRPVDEAEAAPIKAEEEAAAARIQADGVNVGMPN